MSDIKDCPFCDAGVSVLNNEHAYARYDIYPVNKGHILIVPFRHVSDFFELEDEERDAIFKLVDESKILLDEVNIRFVGNLSDCVEAFIVNQPIYILVVFVINVRV